MIAWFASSMGRWFLVALAAGFIAFMIWDSGRNYDKLQSAQDTVGRYEERDEVNRRSSRLNDFDLCHALGGTWNNNTCE